MAPFHSINRIYLLNTPLAQMCTVRRGKRLARLTKLLLNAALLTHLILISKITA
jgi:hypothetical protein